MAANGRILLRLPVSLHAALVERAEQEGVSLNQFVVALVAGGIGYEPGHEPVSSSSS